MRTKLKDQFVPPSYLQDRNSKLHNLRQGSFSVEEYASQFDKLYLRAYLSLLPAPTLIRGVADDRYRAPKKKSYYIGRVWGSPRGGSKTSSSNGRNRGSCGKDRWKRPCPFELSCQQPWWAKGRTSFTQDACSKAGRIHPPLIGSDDIDANKFKIFYL